MTEIIYDGDLGRIEKTSDGRFQAWDFSQEYLGPSDSEKEAYEDLRVAKEIHQLLVDKYNHHR